MIVYCFKCTCPIEFTLKKDRVTVCPRCCARYTVESGDDKKGSDRLTPYPRAKGFLLVEEIIPEVEHTPLPWKACVSSTRDDRSKIYGPTPSLLLATGLTHHDAAFAVKAVNCHEKLVDTLREVAEWLELSGPSGPLAEDCLPVAASMRKVLAKMDDAV